MDAVMRKQLKIVNEFVMITLATAIVAAAVFFFLMPSHLAVGSISGLSSVIGNFIPLPISTIIMIFNVSLLVIGFLLIGREFGGKTIYTSVLLPIIIGIFEKIFPNNTSITADPFLDMICYLFVVSVGLAMLFNRNASSGGLDIIAKLMNKYLRMDLGQAMSMSGMLVALSSALCYDSKTVVLSLLGTYFGGIIVDHFIFDNHIKRRVCVISPKMDEIVRFLLHDLHSGATINEIIGAYDNTVRREVIAIVDKQEYRRLMDFVKRVDPKAFVTVYSVNEIRYQPKV